MTPPDSSHLWVQLAWLVILPIPICCIAWTITHEELFREMRDFCTGRSRSCRYFVQRKFFYMLTCEYCFSHYITLVFLILTRFRLLMDNWFGYVISFFALVFVANAYMSLYGRLRVDIHSERAAAEVQQKEAVLKEKEAQVKEKEIARIDQDLSDSARRGGRIIDGDRAT